MGDVQRRKRRKSVITPEVIAESRTLEERSKATMLDARDSAIRKAEKILTEQLCNSAQVIADLHTIQPQFELREMNGKEVVVPVNDARFERLKYEAAKFNLEVHKFHSNDADKSPAVVINITQNHADKVVAMARGY